MNNSMALIGKGGAQPAGLKPAKKSAMTAEEIDRVRAGEEQVAVGLPPQMLAGPVMCPMGCRLPGSKKVRR